MYFISNQLLEILICQWNFISCNCCVEFSVVLLFALVKGSVSDICEEGVEWVDGEVDWHRTSLVKIKELGILLYKDGVLRY